MQVAQLRPVGAQLPVLLTTGQAARALRRPVRTVKYWCERGWVRTQRTPGGHYRIDRSEVERIAAEPIEDAA